MSDIRSRTIAVVLIATLTASLAAAQDHLSMGTADDERSTDVLGAFTDSMKLLMVEHAIRVGFQERLVRNWAVTSRPRNSARRVNT